MYSGDLVLDEFSSMYATLSTVTPEFPMPFIIRAMMRR